MSKFLYRIDEVMDYLGLGRTKVYELIHRGDLRSVRVDGAVRVPVSALQDFVDRLDATADNALSDAA